SARLARANSLSPNASFFGYGKLSMPCCTLRRKSDPYCLRLSVSIRSRRCIHRRARLNNHPDGSKTVHAPRHRSDQSGWLGDKSTFPEFFYCPAGVRASKAINWVDLTNREMSEGATDEANRFRTGHGIFY